MNSYMKQETTYIENKNKQINNIQRSLYLYLLNSLKRYKPRIYFLIIICLLKEVAYDN